MTAASNDSSVSATEHDIALLQGIWRQVAFEENGVVNPPDIHGGAGALTTIEGRHFSVRAHSGELLLEGSFELDATTMPPAITWVDAIGDDAGRHLPAIYRLEQDRFVFIAADAGMARPAAFRTTPGLTLRGFVRHSG